ncbi:MAG: Holliday junction branch migration protein RuvA [Ignavibacteriaceae bacterium]|jgi:Holliday junction DNA helicase RuvA
MIGFLKGKIISLRPTKIILDVNGVGYLVFISITTFEKISSLPEVSLFIHTHVKEDSLTLFGFFSESEKEMFELLISISGIGPKSAQTILSGISVDELKEAIEFANIGRLIAIPGIGRKTAERLLIELRGKVEGISSLGSESTGQKSSIKNEATTALTTLGYNVKLAEKVVREISTENPDITLEDIIRKSLSMLNK